MNRNLQPLRAFPLAAADFASAATNILRWLQLSDQPLSATQIPSDYIGINVATSSDPAVDDYILERLAELNIKQVRMDFSYDSLEGPGQRLLERLLASGVEVMLDVFPPLDDAKALYRNSNAQIRWREFLSDVFHRYKGKVSQFEIGSTPNRGRWSGFSFLSYQTAWDTALELTHAEDITLVGPNVSDFEPLYNASFLRFMKRLGRAPEIHSDNLFVERVVEPEAYDHRVFGRLATPLLKLNLLKKARILSYIGASNGSLETVCTYKCWTAKRLSRRSAWPEQKRVDYLVRYLALAASSGALRRIYWGPLICARDGLIGDQVDQYPVIDQVSYYQGVRGVLEDFEITDGFHALGYAVNRLSSTHCHALLHQPSGLSVLRLESETNKPIYLCWCRDGMSWPVSTLFSSQDLDRATYLDACGQITNRPAVISEQPLYIEFSDPSALPTLDQAKSFAHGNTIHLSSPHHRSVVDSEGEWLGAGMLRSDHQVSDLNTFPSLRPSVIPTLEETAVLRDARNRIWNVKDPRGLCDQVSVKLNRVVGLKRLTYRFRPSKGKRHWNNACEMLRRGVNTPLPVAYYEQSSKAGIRDSWYLCEFIPGAFSARDVYGAFRDGAEEYRGIDKQAWFKCLAEFTCEMHNRQIVHRDLSAGNLLLRQLEDGTIEPYLIDIGRAWLGAGSGLKSRHRLQDLMRICYKLNWPDRQAFVICYESRMGRSFSGLWTVPFHYYDYKQRFKKALKRKRKK